MKKNNLTAIDFAAEGQAPIEVLLQLGEDGTISAKKLYEIFGLRKADYSRWCRTNIIENKFAKEETDFHAIRLNSDKGGRASTEYKLALPFAERLCVLQNNMRGEQALKYISELQNEFQNQNKVSETKQPNEKENEFTMKMNELSVIDNGATTKTPIEVLLQVDDDGTVSAKKVYEFLGLNQTNYSRWCKKHIIDNDFAEENIDYTALVISEERFNPNATTDYKLTIQLAKKICLVQHNKRGDEAREYFIKCEEALKGIALEIQRRKSNGTYDENELLLDLARAYISKNFDAFAMANQNYIDYQNIQITELKENNKALAEGILEWEDRSKINYAIRIFASRARIPHGVAWNMLYSELKYKHHIGLSLRGKAPYLQHVREDEWPLVAQSFAAICEESEISAAEIMTKAKMSAVTIY